jgi:hypothetical protein
MPQQQALPTWLSLNNANLASQSGQVDTATGFPYAGGGLNLGDYFDLTEQEANQLSYPTNGLLHAGRYRYVQVSSAATAANVKVGTVGYVASGSFVQSVQVSTQGSGQTVGTYTVAASGGGGTGATIQVVVSSATAISATVLTPGSGYTSVPTFTLATGGTPGTVFAQLNTYPNIVTSYDNAATTTRPVVFLNSITPGNYGFVQELGVATVLASSSVGTTSLPAYVNATTAGVVVTTAATVAASPVGFTIGNAIDIPQNSILFKCYMNYVPTIQD